MKISRLEALRKKQRRAIEKGRPFNLDARAGLPDVGEWEYMVSAMFVLGPTRPAGMSDAPTDFPVIESFARSTGRIPCHADDTLGHIELMRLMCCAYYDARQSGTDPFESSPADGHGVTGE